MVNDRYIRVMKASELRIGNYVGRADLGNREDRIEIIIALGEKKATTSGPVKVVCEYDALKPIPLTEEWLLKFGFMDQDSVFQNSVNRYFAKNAVVLSYPCTPPENTYLPGIGFTHESKYFVGHAKHWIQYVHQLQNLYFAFTGNELEIK